MCHGFVLFILKRDSAGDFYFSPLQGETIKKLVPQEKREALPDSVVVRAFAGELYVKAEAAEYVLKRLSPFWKFFVTATSAFPISFRNFVYDLIARVRKSIFGTTISSCPVVPPEQRERFLL